MFRIVPKLSQSSPVSVTTHTKYVWAVPCDLQNPLCLNMFVEQLQVLEVFFWGYLKQHSTHIKASSKSNLIYGCDTACLSATPLLGNTRRPELYCRWRPDRPINSVALFLREPSCSFLTGIWSHVCWGTEIPPLRICLSDFLTLCTQTHAQGENAQLETHWHTNTRTHC